MGILSVDARIFENHKTQNSDTLRSRLDNRTLAEKVIDFALSIIRQIGHTLGLLFHLLFISKPQDVNRAIKAKENSRGLVVLVHGLISTPSTWFHQLKLLEQHEEIDVFAPVVPKRGVCALRDAAEPILSSILSYIDTYPEKPISLLGVSNGSRIATWLEVQLRERAPRTPVMVSTIAGVHLGSSKVDLLEKLGIGNWILNPTVIEELKYQSKTAQNLLNQVAAPLPTNCAAREYEFYATLDDTFVPNLDSSLPTIYKNERTYLLHGESHESIVGAVAKVQIDSCFRWILR